MKFIKAHFLFIFFTFFNTLGFVFLYGMMSYSPLPESKTKEIKIENRSSLDSSLPLHLPLEIVFSHEISSIVNVNNCFKIFPNVKGQWSWKNSKTVQFVPEEDWPAGYQGLFEVTSLQIIKPELELKPIMLPFKMEEFALINAFQNDGNKISSNEMKIGLEFNAKVDPQQLQNYLAIKDKNTNSIYFSNLTKEPSKKLDIAISMDYTNEIKLSIEKDLRPINGSPLGSKIEKTILCSNVYVINYATPHFEDNKGYVGVSANKRQDDKTLRSNIKIIPEMAFIVENKWHGFEIHGDFQGDAEYVILIDKSLNSFKSSRLGIEELKIKFPHCPTYIDFSESGIIYGLHGKKNIELTSTNVDHVEIVLSQIPIYNYNIFLQMNDSYHEMFSETLKESKKSIPFILNQNSKWSVSVKDLIPKIDPGFYEMQVKVKNEQFLEDHNSNNIDITKKIIITDIGVSCRRSKGGLFFWVNRLSDLVAIKNAEIKMFSASNMLLMESRSNDNGIAEIKIDREVFNKIAFILVQSGSDVTYLKLDANIRNFDELGNKYSSANYQAFINIERNMFRPGEKVEIDCAIRNRLGETPPIFPLEVEVLSPDNKILFSKMETLDLNGCFHLSYLAPEVIASGNYLVYVLLADKTVIGHQKFEIASFFPQRLNGKIEVLNKKTPIQEPLKFAIQCEYLSGLSTEGLKVENRIRIYELPMVKIEKISGYKIGYHKKTSFCDYAYLPHSTLDKEGRLKLQYIAPEFENKNTMYEISLVTSIVDKGGREYQLWADQDYFPQKEYLAIKLISKDADKNIFEVKCIDCNGDLVAMNSEMDWSLIDLNQRWSLVSKNNYYSYELSEEENIFKTGSLKMIDGIGELIISGSSVDRQELVVSCKNGLKVNMFINERELLKPKSPYEISFDKIASAKPGEEVNINISAPFLGKALICTETDEVQTHQVIVFNEKRMTIPVKIPESARGSLHLTCTLLQSQVELDEIKNYRANGSCQIILNHQEKKLNIIAKPPIKVNSASEMIIPCQILDYEGNPVKKARVLVSVMDKGIKNLKGVYAPDAFNAFYGPHSAVVEEFDFYQDVVPEKIKIVENLLPGGGGGDEAIRQEKFVSFKERIKLARWQSGILETNENGEVICAVPGFEYQGKLDYQIWCLQSDRFGYVNSEIIVRDEVVLEESFPKYVYAGDKIMVPLVMQNLEETSQKIHFSVKVASLINIKNSFETEFTLEPKGVKNIVLECTANEETGDCLITIQWLVQDKMISKNISMPVISRKSILTFIREGLVNNDEKIVIGSSDSLGISSKNAELRITASPFEQLRGSLDYLIGYPYGCGEQTISKLLPMVYSRPLLEMSSKISTQKEIDYYLNEGIVKLERYQDRKGGIRLWDNNESADIFVSAFGAFLFYQLNKTGAKIDKLTISSLVAFLKNELKENHQIEIKTKCFILYVLALHGEYQKVPINDILLSSPKLDRSSACFLYMAGLLSGVEMPKWNEFSKNSEYYQSIDSSGFYGSYARDLAVELVMANDFDLKINTEALALKLLGQRNKYGHWGSSQSNSWCDFAIMKYLYQFTALEKPEWICDISVDNKMHQASSEKGLLLQKINSENLSIQKNGSGSLYYRLMEKGYSKKESTERISNGLHFEKEILSIKDLKLEDEKKLENGKSYIVKLTVKSDADINNIVIQEFFPACMEYSYLDPKEINKDNDKSKMLNLLSLDIKDDRMYLFPERLLSQVVYEYYYCVRITSKGDFFLPASKGEAMYNAEIFGQSESRNINVR